MSKKDQIIEEIRKIYDPELPVNIYELGLIYDIKVKDEKFAIIKMTLTTPNCPVAESLPKEVKEGAMQVRDTVRKQAKPMRTTTVAPWYRRRVIGAIAKRLLEELAG